MVMQVRCQVTCWLSGKDPEIGDWCQQRLCPHSNGDVLTWLRATRLSTAVTVIQRSGTHFFYIFVLINTLGLEILRNSCNVLSMGFFCFCFCFLPDSLNNSNMKTPKKILSGVFL